MSAMRNVSEDLRRFVSEMPYERLTIFEFVQEFAAGLDSGARVLDVGAGDTPYRELFEHVEYVTNDWTESVHEGAESVDIVGPAYDLPVDDTSFDAVLATQLLEHVPVPLTTLREFHRILRPGGTLGLTVPLTWELHELPHDYWRYTAPGLERLLADAGYEDVSVAPRNGCFTTLAQLMLNAVNTLGPAGDGLDGQREEARRTLAGLSEHVAALEPLDTQRLMPLGYSATARRPST